MTAVLTPLGMMAVIVAVGWVLGRLRLLGDGAEVVIARLVFMVASPALLFSTIVVSDLHLLLTRTALVTVVSTAVVAITAVAILRFVLRRDAGSVTVGGLAASYLNAGNLGLPLAVYLLDNPVAVVPTLLFQLLILAPVSFVVLESRGVGRGRKAVLASATKSLRNPIIIATLTGVAFALVPWSIPQWALAPFDLVGATAAPLALIMLGMSLSHRQAHAERPPRTDVVVVVVLRALVHPVLAWGLGTWLGLSGVALFGVVAMASLPTAQNILVYAMRFGTGQGIARTSQVVTTLISVPLLIAVAVLLGPAA